jgi:hypothetical protein
MIQSLYQRKQPVIITHNKWLMLFKEKKDV